jgi:hypothetical protein
MQTTEAPCANECQHCGGPIAAGDSIPVDLRSQMPIWRHADCQTLHLTGAAGSVAGQLDNSDLVAAAMGLPGAAQPPAPLAPPARAASNKSAQELVAEAMGLTSPSQNQE